MERILYLRLIQAFCIAGIGFLGLAAFMVAISAVDSLHSIWSAIAQDVVNTWHDVLSLNAENVLQRWFAGAFGVVMFLAIGYLAMQFSKKRS